MSTYVCIVIEDLDLSSSAQASRFHNPQVLSAIKIGLSKELPGLLHHGLDECVYVGPKRDLPGFLCLERLVFHKVLSYRLLNMQKPILSLDELYIRFRVASSQYERMLLKSQMLSSITLLSFHIEVIIHLLRGQAPLLQMCTYHKFLFDVYTSWVFESSLLLKCLYEEFQIRFTGQEDHLLKAQGLLLHI